MKPELVIGIGGASVTPEQFRADMEAKIQVALGRLASAIEQHKPIAVFGLFSGGHDSFSACYIASWHAALTSMVHINTGIGVKATHEFVRDTCSRRGWNLREYFASENVNAKGEPDPQVYREFCLRDGFPGPHGHGMMYMRLKERQLIRLQRECGASAGRKARFSKFGKLTTPAIPARRVMYISGCRSEESERRMANTEEVQVDGQRIWVAPIHDWTKLDTSLLIRYLGQPRNPVVDAIHKSGECLCGAFAKRGELEELGCYDITREAFLEIKSIEREVVPIHGRGWGERPMKGGKRQMKIPGMLCWGCGKDDVSEWAPATEEK